MMANAKTQQDLDEARRVRDEYRVEKTRRIATLQADLDEPVIGAGWIVDQLDGTLSSIKLKNKEDLVLTVDAWDSVPVNPGDFDTLSLEWAPGANPTESQYEEVDSEVVTAPIPAGTFPLNLTIPNARFSPDGPSTVRYKVTAPNGEQRQSGTVSLISDTLPPWRNLEPEALSLPTTELTDAFLTANPGGLVGTLPDYDDFEVDKDRVAFYWLTTPLPSDPNDLPLPVSFPNLGADKQVTYPLSVLQSSQDKDYYAFYLLFDKAGNRSPISEYKRVDVALGDLPAALLDPVVPLAADGLVDLADARLGVVVQIPQFENYKSTDRIELTWGTGVAEPQEIGISPRFPIEITVPALILRDAYDKNLGGEQDTSVSYRVLRGCMSSAVKAITVSVDFSVIGPDPVPDPDPDWPDPVNDQLTPARVFGRSGTPELNKLVRADENLSADLKFDLHDPLEEDEEVDFFWGTEHVTEARYTVQAGDVAGEERAVEIPWRYIEAANNGTIPVHYRIHAPGSDNYQRPEANQVAVNAVTLKPDAPDFEGLTSTGWLNCTSLFIDPSQPLANEPAIRVKVPDLSQYLKAGDTVTLVWVALRGDTGEDIITGTEKREEITLDTDAPATGFTWFVEPYVDHVLPTYDYPPFRAGRGRARYEFTLNTEVVTSKVAEAKVGVFDPAGPCPLP